ncbi:MAG: hypothetical protein FJW21_02710 [Acidimicrobiia bacterium]|nr:hypothetical protein [Acidimicrobiia bacterium]
MTDRTTGHSIVEVLISMTLGLLVTAALVLLVVETTRLALAQSDRFELQQRARVALDLMTRDLRIAGAGVDRGPATGALAHQFPAVWARRIGRGGDAPTVARTSAFTVVAVPDTLAQTTSLDTVMSTSTAITVHAAAHCTAARPACGFAAGTTFGVFDDAGALSIWSTDRVSGQALSVRPVAVAATPIDADAVVAEVLVRGYVHDPATRQLRYFDGEAPHQPLIDGVDQMVIRYFDAAGEVPVAIFSDGPWLGSGETLFDVDLLRVRRVRIELILRAGRAEFRAVAEVSPRSLGRRS